MLKLTPISKEQYDTIRVHKAVQDAVGSIPMPQQGVTGPRGATGAQGAAGITTTVTKEVLANKEKLLEKEEFEKFKKIVMEMENSLRQSLAKTNNYFPGGGTTIIEAEDPMYDKLIDDESPYIYIGEVEAGTNTSAPSWRIKRIDSTNDPDVDIRWADGTTDFTKTWDDRATYTY